MGSSQGMAKLVTWDTETHRKVQSLQCFPEDSEESSCSEEMAGGDGSEAKQEQEQKLSDLQKPVWRSPSWGSHSAPSSPRYVDPTAQHNPTPQNIPFPLTPHPQHGARQRQAFNKPLGDDRRDWAPPTPGRRGSTREMNSRIRNGLDIKLDLGAVQRARGANEPTETQLKRNKFAFFDKDCSRVAEHIYIGSDAVARNRATLLANKITHVLNCVGFVCPECFPDDFKYKTLWLQDSPCEDITSILYDVFDYFEDVRVMGGRVFVHCLQGVSRSTSLVIAYLMWRKGRSFEDAFHDVKTARGVTNPNMGFACQLLLCQKRVHAAPASPSSVVRMYRMAPHSPYDPLHLVPKTVSNPSAAALDSRGAFILHIPSAIFVWVGKRCKEGMDSAAKAAVNQVVKYERAQGKICFIHDGDEPAEFWDALDKGSGSDSDSADSNTKVSSASSFENSGRISGDHHKQNKNLQQADLSQNNSLQEGVRHSVKKLHSLSHGISILESDLEMRIVKDYDYDYDVYHIALEGGVVPPANGLVTHVPARDSGWRKVHESLNSLRDISTPKVANPETGNQGLESTNLNIFDEILAAGELHGDSKHADIPTDPFPLQYCSSSSSESAVSTSFAASPSISSGSISSPSFTSNTPSGESSVSEPSSSSSESPPAFSFSFSNTRRIDHSPAKLESKPSQKSHSISLAERRGSMPRPLRLPALIDSSTPNGSSKSLSLSSLGSAEKH